MENIVFFIRLDLEKQNSRIAEKENQFLQSMCVGCFPFIFIALHWTVKNDPYLRSPKASMQSIDWWIFTVV